MPLSRIDGCARLLNFLRQVKKIWRGTQEWYWQNVFFGIHSRQYVGECERWLVQIGVAHFQKVRGFTRQMNLGFIGWPWERGEEDGENDYPEGNGSNPYSSGNAAYKHSDVGNLTSECKNPDIDQHITFHKTSSQNPPEGKNVAFENRKIDQEGGCQQSCFIENGASSQLTDNIENGKEHFPRKQKVIGSGKSSGRASPPVLIETVNQVVPATRQFRGSLMVSPDDLPSDQRRKYEDPEFIRYIAYKWDAMHDSYTGSQKCLEDKISIVERHLLKNPPAIDIEWKAYIQGRVTGAIRDLFESLEQGLNRQHFDRQKVERYLPSMMVELQLENPVASEPILQLMGQALEQHRLAGQKQQQELFAAVEADEARESASLAPAVTTIAILGSDSDPEPVEAIVVEEEAEPEVQESSEESAPSIEALQKTYKYAAGQLIVRMQIARNPQWGYAIVDGQIVKVGQDARQEVEAEAEVQDASEGQVAEVEGQGQDAAVPETKKMSMQELDAHIRKVYAPVQPAKTQELMMDFQHAWNERKAGQEQELPPALEPCPPPKLSAHSALQQSGSENGDADWEVVGEKVAAIEAAAIDGDTESDYEIVVVGEDGELEQEEQEGWDWEAVEVVDDGTTADDGEEVAAPKVAPTEELRIQIAEEDLRSPNHWSGVQRASAWASFLTQSKLPGLEVVSACQRFGTLIVSRASDDVRELLGFVNWNRKPSDEVISAAQLERDREVPGRMAWEAI